MDATPPGFYWQYWPSHREPPRPMKIGFVDPVPPVTREEFDALKRELEELKKHMHR